MTVMTTEGTGISIRVGVEDLLSDAPAAVPEPTAMTSTQLRLTVFPAAKTPTVFVPISTDAGAICLIWKFPLTDLASAIPTASSPSPFDFREPLLVWCYVKRMKSRYGCPKILLAEERTLEEVSKTDTQF